MSPKTKNTRTGKAGELAKSEPTTPARQGLFTEIPLVETLTHTSSVKVPGVMTAPHSTQARHMMDSPRIEPLQPHCSSINCATGATTKVPTPAAHNTIDVASDRLIKKCFDTMTTLGIYIRPNPIPVMML